MTLFAISKRLVVVIPVLTRAAALRGELKAWVGWRNLIIRLSVDFEDAVGHLAWHELTVDQIVLLLNDFLPLVRRLDLRQYEIFRLRSRLDRMRASENWRVDTCCRSLGQGLRSE